MISTKYMNATVKSKARKLKIINKLILNRKQVSLYETGLYETVLPLVKRNVMLFQK